MRVFRSPLYLDIDILVPLANYHGIEVMVDVALSQRDRGERTGKAGANVALPIPGSPGFEFGGSRGSEAEITQARTVKDHPTNALNRLLDELAKANDITTDLSGSAITRHQIVECDGDWEISPATDVGAMLTSMVTIMSQNPSALESSAPPPEFYSLMRSDPERGSVVLETTLEGADQLHVLVLLDSGCLVDRASLDSLEDERTVFGQVDVFLPEGSQYSLEKFFLSGFSRAIRRSISAEQLLSGMGASFGRPMTINDLKIDGPLVVVKPIAIY
ncbi:hypothetical protein EDL96_13245 [Kocuria soli]|uniref:Uncharacterized protein n=1 Tax=Kocuria soli TaxID=2485125 RepID=A0A3N3ZLT1_9MICC|nr:hypothetical protein [Kocuria soli]ROZ61498.1 hypothetical protein EDL96_13245 [Kocuria soli]